MVGGVAFLADGQLRRIGVSAEEIAVVEGPGAAGLNSVVWDFRRTSGADAAAPPAGQRGGQRGGMVRLAPPGDYVVTIEVAGKKLTTRATVRPTL